MINLMTINEFIELTKQEPLNWINYCEIILTVTGKVLLARPSHTQAIINYEKELLGKTDDDIRNEIPNMCLPLEWFVDKNNFVAVWYCGYMYPSKGLNRFQKRSIKLLEDNGLIQKYNQYNMVANEYTLHLKRKELYDID